MIVLDRNNTARTEFDFQTNVIYTEFLFRIYDNNGFEKKFVADDVNPWEDTDIWGFNIIINEQENLQLGIINVPSGFYKMDIYMMPYTYPDINSLDIINDTLIKYLTTEDIEIK